MASLVSFVHPTLSKYQNQTNTFILMSIFIIYSGINSGLVLVTSVCLRMSILCTSYSLVQYICTHLVAFLVSFVHPTLSGHQNQISTFAIVSLIIIYSGVNSRHGIGDFCVCEDEHSVCTLNYINRYCTHLEAFLLSFVHPTLFKYQNQTSTFILISTFIIYSGVNSGLGIGDLLCVCILNFHVRTSI